MVETAVLARFGVCKNGWRRALRRVRPCLSGVDDSGRFAPDATMLCAHHSH